MNLTTIFNVFIRDFRKQKKRIALTLLALIWGTISIMMLLAFGEGLHQQLSLNRAGMGDSIGILWGGQTSIPYRGLGKGRRVPLYEDDPDYLKGRIPELKYMVGEYHRWGAKTKYNDAFFSEHVVGVGPEFEHMRNYIPEAGGRMINRADVEQRRRVAFLGHTLKNRLFGDEDPVGKKIMVHQMPFVVIGVMIDKMQMNSYSGSDTDVLAIPNTTFKAVFGDPFLDNIVYQTYEPGQMKMVEKQIFESMGAKYRFDKTDDRALSIWDTVEGNKEFTNILIGIKVFLGIIGFLTLLIAGVGVANIMYVSIKERTREIGIKMAVGARKSLILTQFLLEATLITLIGGAIGMAITYVLTESFKRIPIESDVLEFMGRPTVSLDIGIAVILILSVMGIISGIFPAMKAASVNPVESLRYE